MGGKKNAQTIREKYGEDFFKVIGSKGGKNNPNKFNSERGRKAVLKRWLDNSNTKRTIEENEEPNETK